VQLPADLQLAAETITTAHNNVKQLLNFTSYDALIQHHLCHLLQDADLELAAKNIVKGGYSYSGQRCTAVKLVLAHESIADALVEKVRPQLGRQAVGLSIL